MLLFYLSNYLLIKSNIITHNCNFSDRNIGMHQKESFDYQISCESQKIQKIDLENLKNADSISIFDESSVILNCSLMPNFTENLTLSIYDNPTITFENYCHFNSIEIYGLPSFHLFSNSHFLVDNLVLSDSKYQFPFEYKNVFYSNDSRIKFKLPKGSKSTETFNYPIFNCENDLFEISINDNYIIVKCSGIYEYTLLYPSIPKYVFNINNTKAYVINQCTSDELTNQKMKIVLSSLKFFGEKEVTFKNFNKLDSIEPYANNDIKGTWINIKQSDIYDCIWIVKPEYAQKYEDMFKRGWKKVCLEIDTYLYCCDSDLSPRNIFVISKGGSLAIIIIIICSIFIIFISLCIIAYYRYQDYRKIDNSHTE